MCYFLSGLATVGSGHEFRRRIGIVYLIDFSFVLSHSLCNSTLLLFIMPKINRRLCLRPTKTGKTVISLGEKHPYIIPVYPLETLLKNRESIMEMFNTHRVQYLNIPRIPRIPRTGYLFLVKQSHKLTDSGEFPGFLCFQRLVDTEMNTKERAVIAGAVVRENVALQVAMEVARVPSVGAEADERHKEIVLDHALAKSSNVGSPIDDSSVRSEPPAEAGDATGANIATIKSADPPKRIEVIDLEDDFFSMSTKPKYIDPSIFKKDKKKKKKKKRKHSDSPTLELQESTITNSTQPLKASKQSTIPDGVEVVEIGSDDDAIETGDASTTEVKRAKLIRQITPPPMSEEEFRRIYRAKNAKTYEDDEIDTYIEPDNFAQRLARLNSTTPSLTRERTNTGSSNLESFEQEEEKQVREYNLNVTSFIPGSKDHAISLQVKGSKKVNSIINKVVTYLKSLENIVTPQYHFLYNPDTVVLYHNQQPIHPLMKVDTALKDVSYVPGKIFEIGLYTKSQGDMIEEEKIRAEEARIRQLQKDEEYEKMIKAQDVDSQLDDIYADDFKDVDQEAAARATQHHTQTQQSEEPEDQVDYFKIGLKGEDNKKIIVKVSPETKIMDLVKHYLMKKQLPLETKVRLDFDDEEVDLTGTVGDTELEEDFTLDVYLIPN